MSRGTFALGLVLLVSCGGPQAGSVALPPREPAHASQPSPSDASAAVVPDAPDAAAARASRGLASDVVRGFVVQHHTDVLACYPFSLTGDREGGFVTVRWRIRPDGNVRDARIVSSTLNGGPQKNERVESCILKAVSSWQFPASDDTSEATYPFALGDLL